MNVPSDDFRKAKERLMNAEDNITATELHRHIQSAIFGPDVHENMRRFNDLQWKLHEIVDWWEDARKTEVLKAWHESKEKNSQDPQ